MPASLRSDYPIKTLLTARTFWPESGAIFTGIRIVSYHSGPPFEFSKLARDFYDVPGTPHPYYGMIGFVFETSAEGKVWVFFSKSWSDPEPNNTPGWTGIFNPEELAKIGTAVINVPYEKLRRVRDGFSRLFAKAWNERYGTNFETQEEVLKFLLDKEK